MCVRVWILLLLWWVDGCLCVYAAVLGRRNADLLTYHAIYFYTLYTRQRLIQYDDWEHDPSALGTPIIASHLLAYVHIFTISPHNDPLYHTPHTPHQAIPCSPSQAGAISRIERPRIVCIGWRAPSTQR